MTSATGSVVLGRVVAAWAGLVGYRFMRDVGILTVSNVLVGVVGLAQGIFVARWLGPESYGVAALVMSFPTLVNSVFDVKAKEVAIKFLGEFDASRDRMRALAMCKLAYVLDLGAAAVASMVVLAAAPWAAEHLVRRPDMAGLVLLYGVALVPQALVGTSWAVLASRGEFPVLAALSVGVGTLKAILVIWFVMSGWGVAGMVWGTVGATALGGLAHGVWAHRSIRRALGAGWLHGSWGTLRGKYRTIFRYLLYTDAGTLLSMLSGQLDVVAVGYLVGPTHAGLYKLARSVSAIVGHVSGPLHNVSYARLSSLFRVDDPGLVPREAMRLGRLVGIPIAATVALGALVVPWVLVQLVGTTFAPAMGATQILLVAASLNCAFFWLRPAYMAVGIVGTYVTLSTLFNVLYLVILLPMVTGFGYVGAAVAVLGREIVENGVEALWLTRSSTGRLAQEPVPSGRGAGGP